MVIQSFELNQNVKNVHDKTYKFRRILYKYRRQFMLTGILKTWQEQQEHNLKGDICYLENICGAEQPEMCTIKGELNIDGGKYVLVLFLN